MKIKLDKDPLVLVQNNYLTSIVNFYIAYDLDACSRNLTNSFKFKTCLFGATNIIENGYSFYSARNVVIFGVNNSSSSHADNRKNNILVLGEGPN